MPLSSRVITARRALALIGTQTNIESFSEDSPEAAISGLFYDQSLFELLSEFDWSFARKFQKLPEHPAAPVNNWKYRYALPADLVVLRGQVNPQGRKRRTPPGQIQNIDGVVTFMTDVEKTEVFYTAKVDTDAPYFKKVHTFLLASYLAGEYLADEKRSKDMADRYLASLDNAKAIDSLQETPDDPADASWIDMR